MIPKILHSIWLGTNKSKFDFSSTWSKVLSDWKIEHWTDEKIYQEFGSDKLLIEISKTFGPTTISDYVRLLILKKFGGVYSDLDVFFLKDIDKFRKYKSFLTYQFPKIMEEEKLQITPLGLSLKKCIENKINVYKFYNEDIYLNNNLIGSEPNSILINTFIDFFIENIKKDENERLSYIDYGCGPALTTKVANNFVNLNGYTQHSAEVSVFESNIFHPVNYIQYSKTNYKRDFDKVIQEQIEIAKKLDSYCVHFQTSQEVDNYI